MREDRLREIRQLRGLTQDDLARRVGVHKQQIYRIEAGIHKPTSDVLTRLAKELEVSMDYLSGLVDKPQDHLSEEKLTPMERKLLSAYRGHDLREVMRVVIESDQPQNESDVSANQVAVNG